MARVPTMTIEECEAQLGPRGVARIDSNNRAIFRKWIAAKGFPSALAASMGLKSMNKAYADTTDRYVQACIRNAAERGQTQDMNGEDHDTGEDQSMTMNSIHESAAVATTHVNGHDALAEARDGADKLANALADILANSKRGVDVETVTAIVRQEVTKAIKDIPAQVLEIRRDGDFVAKVEGTRHPKFNDLLMAINAKTSAGQYVNVWIAGPAGTGKTHAAHMAATALGLEFEHNGALSMPHELLGFIDAAGNYHDTAFRRAYENGTAYLFDEVDGSDNAALLALNAALANGLARFPDKAIPRHENTRIMAAANTWGLGATADYVGRAKLDAAFLNRFPVKLFFDYDSELETAISGNPDFARRVQKARDKARQVGLKVVITPRDTMAGAALIAAGFTPHQAAEMTYLATLSAEQKRQIEG